MKHQYFGDKIDLFKFDLLEFLRRDLSLDGITYVSMLTGYDERNDGNRRKYDTGTKNKELLTFVKKYNDIKDRNVAEIKKHFDAMGIQLSPFLKEFKHLERDTYFSEVSRLDFDHQLIFFDPDNGLEIKKSNRRHIKYKELRSFYDAFKDDNSVICVIQFKPRKTWKDTFKAKMAKLQEHDFQYVTYIHDKSIAFFIIAKSEERLEEVQISLDKYKTDYDYPYLEIKLG